MTSRYPEVPALVGTVAFHRASGFRGTVARCEPDGVVLRSKGGAERIFRFGLAGAFAVDGEAVTLVRPRRSAQQPRPAITASGSLAAPKRPAQVAKASRILVEGIHDAELLEKVWGDDLRAEAIVVEPIDGVDSLEDAVRAFQPGPGRRLGILVDHLVPGSKEARAAARVDHPHVLVTGTPFVDVWQAVRPRAVGIERWPTVPKGRPWKDGICEALGVEEDPAVFWRRLLGSVRTYADLDPSLVGAVERLLDFLVTPAPAND
ncbi:MAG: DUF3097 family protein [Actinomycetota bacterium]